MKETAEILQYNKSTQLGRAIRYMVLNTSFKTVGEGGKLLLKYILLYASHARLTKDSNAPKLVLFEFHMAKALTIQWLPIDDPKSTQKLDG
jgi:hypothetical protein